MKRLWGNFPALGGQREPFLINPHRIGGRRRKVRSARRRHRVRSGRNRLGRFTRRARTRNPRRRVRRNDPLTVLGVLNPKRRRATRRRKVVVHMARRTRARRRHRNARRVVVVNHYPRRRRRRRNPVRLVNRHRRHVYRNRYRHRRHRNPSASARVSIFRPTSWIGPISVGILGGAVAAIAPRAIGAAVTPTQAYVVQGAVGALGTIVLPMLGFRGAYPMAWLVGSAVMIAGDLVGRHLLTALGLQYYPYGGMGQEPYYPPRLYGANVGMYPYGGGEYMFNFPEQAEVGAPEAPFSHFINN